jgi:hypothetical protein
MLAEIGHRKDFIEKALLWDGLWRLPGSYRRNKHTPMPPKSLS